MARTRIESEQGETPRSQRLITRWAQFGFIHASVPDCVCLTRTAFSMHAEIPVVSDQPVILGFDPGRQKCGIAVMGVDRILQYNQVVDAGQAVTTVQQLCVRYPVTLIVIGDQTSSREWQQRLTQELTDSLRVVTVDERNSTLEARDRYWQMYPPAGLGRLLPQAFRTIPRPIDDIVAILLIERYLARLATRLPEL